MRIGWILIWSNGLEMTAFKEYLESFESETNSLIADIINFYQADDSKIPLTEGDIKDLFNITIYGGGQSTWVNQVETGVYRNERGEVTYTKEETPLLKNKDTEHDFYTRFESEARNIMMLIYKHNDAVQEAVCTDLPLLNLKETTRAKYNEREHARMRRVMSYVCGILEVHITPLKINSLAGIEEEKLLSNTKSITPIKPQYKKTKTSRISIQYGPFIPLWEFHPYVLSGKVLT